MELLLVDIFLSMFLAYVLFAITQGVGERIGIFPIISLSHANVKEQFKTWFTGEPVLFFVIQIIVIWIGTHMLYFYVFRGYEFGW